MNTSPAIHLTCHWLINGISFGFFVGGILMLANHPSGDLRIAAKDPFWWFVFFATLVFLHSSLSIAEMP